MKILLAALLFTCTTLTAFTQQQARPRPDKASPHPLAGTWTLVSVANIYPDSSRVYPYGKDPKGLLVFDEQGNYAIQILQAGRPSIASGDKNKATPEEYAALVKGSNAHFGHYTVDEAGKTISFHIEQASFPNWEGTLQKRTYIYTGRELKYVVTQTTQGGQAVVAEVVWRKL